MGRPPKEPADRQTNSMRLPLTDAEKALIVEAAEAIGAKPVTWARDALLRAAKKAASGKRGS